MICKDDKALLNYHDHKYKLLFFANFYYFFFQCKCHKICIIYYLPIFLDTIKKYFLLKMQICIAISWYGWKRLSLMRNLVGIVPWCSVLKFIYNTVLTCKCRRCVWVEDDIICTDALVSADAKHIMKMSCYAYWCSISSTWCRSWYRRVLKD